jgi:mannose-6-phosphate isomerase-like protein (cupin superfamily)
MHVVNHTCLEAFSAMGCRSVHAVERGFGIASFELWSITVEPGARMPPTPTACDTLPPTSAIPEQVLVVHSGRGVLTVDGTSREVVAPCHVTIPAASSWTLFNGADEILCLVVAQTLPSPP